MILKLNNNQMYKKLIQLYLQFIAEYILCGFLIIQYLLTSKFKIVQ